MTAADHVASIKNLELAQHHCGRCCNQCLRGTCQWHLALWLLRGMPEQQLQPNAITYGAVIRACEKINRADHNHMVGRQVLCSLRAACLLGVTTRAAFVTPNSGYGGIAACSSMPLRAQLAAAGAADEHQESSDHTSPRNATTRALARAIQAQRS